MKLVIDRKKWLRGDGRDSYLIRPSDGKQCCLGFLGLACGYEPADLHARLSPLSTFESEKDNKWCIPVGNKDAATNGEEMHSAIILELTRINDHMYMKDNDREEKLTEAFASVGVEVTFEG